VQVKDYNYDSPGFSPATGHFTQVVWKDTSYLGCAINSACDWPVYVCQYRSPGNVLGHNWTEQVPKLTGTTASAESDSGSAVDQPTPVPAPVSPEVITPAPTEVTGVTATTLVNVTEVIETHNVLRARHQAPGLEWDDGLAKAAQVWADTCPWTPSETKGVGENMAWGMKDFESVISGWYEEVSAGAGGWRGRGVLGPKVFTHTPLGGGG
jgi:hypothetical protein